VNLAGLFLCLIIIAGIVRSLFFRTSARRVQKKLFSVLGQMWRAGFEDLENDTRVYLTNVKQALRESKELSDYCLTRSDEAGRQLTAPDGEEHILFSSHLHPEENRPY
jgi:hypothetical protein